MKLALATVVGVLLVGAPTAQAATRYASTDGFNGGPCTSEFPCSFKSAIEGAAAGDEVIVKAGSYALASGATNPAANLTVRGEAPGTVFVTAPGTAVSLFGGTDSVVRDLKIEVSSGTAVLARNLERVNALTHGGSGGACRANRVVDSICVNQNGLGIEVDGPNSVIRNATAIATATAGLRISGGDGLVYNTIARAASGPDVLINSETGKVTLHHSNFVDTGTLGFGTAAFVGTTDNSSAAPAFVNAAGGDYHQQPTSITIDRGAPTDGLDVDGDLRTLGSGTDVGGDEAVAPPIATIAAPGNVTTTSASFNGQANTGGLGATYWFEYGPEGGAMTQTPPRGLPERPNVVPVSADVAGLQPGTPYVVVLRVRNDFGTATSAAERFTTAGTGTGGADREPPILGSLRLTNKIFAVAPSITPIAAAKRGTTLRFRVSEPGTATIAVQRAASGRRRGKKCVAPRRARPGARRCIRWLKRVTLRRNTASGLNSVPFSGRVGASGISRKLGPGRYRFRVVASDAAGNRSDPASVRFRIVRR